MTEPACSGPEVLPTHADLHAGQRRLHRRAGAGAILAAACWVSAFTVGLVRNTPADNAAVIGVEIASGVMFLLCALVVVQLRLWAWNTANRATVPPPGSAAADEMLADHLEWAVGLGEDIEAARRSLQGRQALQQ